MRILLILSEIINYYYPIRLKYHNKTPFIVFVFCIIILSNETIYNKKYQINVIRRYASLFNYNKKIINLSY